MPPAERSGRHPVCAQAWRWYLRSPTHRGPVPSPARSQAMVKKPRTNADNGDIETRRWVEQRGSASDVGRHPLEQLQHFPKHGKLMLVKPVILLPGRAKLETKPCPSGTMTAAKTIGMERVSCRSAATAGLPLARIASGFAWTSSVT